MDAPPSDGDEKIAEIFMVSSDDPAITLLRESLEEKGYRVTVFPDGTRLNETLGPVKPDLLIYECETGEQEGYELIRRMKLDEDLRAIPTLVLSGASDMNDLLKILESQADNFIAPPYIAPDHLSLIDGMLTGQAGQHRHGEIIKQFNIRHDEQIYVVAATSRTLLEYLLSSFEILVSRSAELSRVSSELEEVSGSVKRLEQTITGQARDIESLKSDIAQKESKINGLLLAQDELSVTLSQKTDEIDTLTRESDVRRSRFEGLENELKEEKIRTALLEEKLNSSMLELGQQKSALLAEKNRSLGAEEEISVLRLGKAQSESELNEVIHGLNNTVKLQESEIADLRAGIDTQTNLSTRKEQEIITLRQERSQSESALNRLINELKQTAKRQESEIADLRTGIDTQTNLSTRKEQEIITLRQEKSQSESELNEVIHGLNNTVKRQESEISQLKSVGEEETSHRISAENQVALLSRELEQSRNNWRIEMEVIGRKVVELEESLKVSAEALEAERRLRQITETKIYAPVQLRGDPKTKAKIREEDREQPITDQAGTRPGAEGEPDISADRMPSTEAGLHPDIPSKSQADQIAGTLPAEPEDLTELPAFKEHGIVMERDTGQSDPGKERHLVQQPLLQPDDEAGPAVNRSLVIQEPAQLPVVTRHGSSREVTPPKDNSAEQTESFAGSISEPEMAENLKGIRDTLQFTRPPHESREKSGRGVPQGEILFSGREWLDLLKWAHHSDALSEDQRARIIRMGRLIQKDRKLTKNQQDQVREILALVHTLGYRPGE